MSPEIRISIVVAVVLWMYAHLMLLYGVVAYLKVSVNN